MSSSSKVTPSACDSRVAYDLVVAPVAKPGHREGQHVAARAAEPVHRLARDDQRVRRVEAAAHADDGLGRADGVEPLLEAGDLDVVGLVAVELEPRRVVGHEREAVDLAHQADVALRRAERELDLAELVGGVVGAPVVVEAPLPQPLLPQPVEVDVDHGAARAVGEPLALAEQVAALVDHRLAVPAQVGRRLALSRRGIDVRRQAPRARAAHEQPTVLGAGDRDRAAAQVGQHRRAGERGAGARRHRHPHVLAHLDVHRQAGDVVRREHEVGPERHRLAADAPSTRPPCRRPARTTGARRTPGSWAGTPSAPRPAPRRGG